MHTGLLAETNLCLVSYPQTIRNVSRGPARIDKTCIHIEAQRVEQHVYISDLLFILNNQHRLCNHLQL